MKHQFTIFTPTHNRAHLIGGLYESLKRQTCKDFVWLVIDDGSTDNTSEIIKAFQNEKKLDIEYRFIENGFLYLAEKLSAQIADSQYIIRIDDDDQLLDNCVECFLLEWKNIEKEGIADIGEIRALAVREDGKIAGNYQPVIGSPPIDTTYIERHLSGEKQLENIACRKVEVWKQLFHKDDTQKWLFDKVNYVEDCLLWFRLSRVCRTRYVFIPLRLYCDNPISITHNNLSSTYQHQYNKIFGNYMILNEMSDYYWKAPHYFLKHLYSFGLRGFSAKLPYRKMVCALDNILCKTIFVLASPLLYFRSKC